MKQIVVVSGKGGTGKTSLTGALARLSSRSMVMGDCDVDASNLGLLFPGEDHVDDPFVGGQTAKVDEGRCTACGECEEVCRFQAVEVGHSARIQPNFCEGCRACSAVCPEEAITFVPKECGRVLVRQTDRGPLVHAALHVGEDNSGKLVTEVRKRSRAKAVEDQAEIVLLDGPPGIGCPVHAAIGGTDLVLAVTEPSRSGLHDLERLLVLCEGLSLKAAVIINKWDLDPEFTDEIRERLKARGVPVLTQVPFDREVPDVLCRGGDILEVKSVAKALEGIWDQILNPG